MPLYISYTLHTWSRDLNKDFALNNCLLGCAKVTKNTDPDKYKYSGCGIRFYSRSEFWVIDGSIGRNVIIFLEVIWAHLCIFIIKVKIY